MNGVDRRLIGLLVLALLIGCLAVGCGPSTATVKVTLKDQDGVALAGSTVTIGDKSATTDAGGVATVKEVPPGQVTIQLSGEGVTGEHTETVKKGDNAFSYTVDMHAFSFVPFGDIAKMRLKISSNGQEMAEAVLVSDQGSHWVMSGGQVIVIGDQFYVKVGDEPWTLVPTEELTGSGMSMAAYTAFFAQNWAASLETFDDQLATEGITAEFKGTGTANEYSCDIYEATIAESESGPIRFYIINEGEYKGRITRYEDVTPSEHSGVMDIYDFGAELNVEAPF